MIKNLKRKKTFLIAEVGINHSGSLKNAKKLVLLAKKYQFDAVKFQKRDLDICIPDAQKNIMRATPWGNISYLNYKKKIELNNVRKNDLIFWKGHVGIILSKKKLIHAYGPMKKTLIMGIDQTIKRIDRTAKLKVIGIKRV